MLPLTQFVNYLHRLVFHRASSETGCERARFGVMSENAQKDACHADNPRKANHAQVVDIFKAALKSGASVVDFKAAV